MEDSRGRYNALQLVAAAATVLNLLLCAIYFPLVPLLGWLNLGHANWATAWIPDALIRTAIPAAYYVYWHFWFVFSLPVLAVWAFLYRRTRSRVALVLAASSIATVLVYWLVRIVLAGLGIRPDSV